MIYWICILMVLFIPIIIKIIGEIIMTKNIIVSRHGGAISWLKDHGIEGEVHPAWKNENASLLNKGDLVVGNLPLTMISKILDTGATFGLLNLPEVPLDKRGQELTPQELSQFGANVMKITSIEIGGRII
jgi:putative CRISPR-associated protein (TIGR02620 family)